VENLYASWGFVFCASRCVARNLCDEGLQVVNCLSEYPVLCLARQTKTKDDLLFCRDRHMASRWLAKVGRTAQYIKQEAAKSTADSPTPYFSIFHFPLTAEKKVNRSGHDAVAPSLSLYKFKTEDDVRTWVHGSDADIGGLSTSNWALGEDGRAKFSGVMRLKVRPEAEGRLRGGYAGIRARVRTFFFSRAIKLINQFPPFSSSCSLSPLCSAPSHTI